MSKVITDQQIDQVYNDLRRTHGGNRNDYFGLLYLEREFGLPREQAVEQIAFHGNDYGFDGFHLDVARRNLYLFQFKYSASHQQFKESMQRLIQDGITRVFAGPNQDVAQNAVLNQLKSVLYESQSVVDRVLLHFVFNGDPADAQRSPVLDSLKEDLEAKRHLVEGYFGRPVPFLVEFRSALKRGTTVPPPGSHTFDLELQGDLSHPGPEGQVMHLGFVRLADLERMLERLGPRFFDRNIRGCLAGTKPGDDTGVNREILKALRAIVLDRKEEPSVFAFNHNGVTVFAERMERADGEGRYRITEPRLLNGAQTVSTFARFRKQHADAGVLQERAGEIDGLRVLCKVITNADKPFVTSVTINNNRQNPVEPWNLHANDMIQLELQELFDRELHLYYERQENAFSNLSDDDLEQMGLRAGHVIELYRLAQTFLITDGEIDKLSRMREVFESESIYNALFSPSRLQADPRKIVLCYKVQFRLRRLLTEILEKGQSKYWYLNRGRNLLWALVCQGLLNDSNVDAVAAEFGNDLGVPGPLMDKLAWLASARCRFILNELVGLPEYADKVAEDNYSFLRTNAAYDRSMGIAYKRWKWVKKRLR